MSKHSTKQENNGFVTTLKVRVFIWSHSVTSVAGDATFHRCVKARKPLIKYPKTAVKGKFMINKDHEEKTNS